MRTRRLLISVLAGAALAGAAALPAAPTRADDAVLQLKWAELIPAAAPRQHKSFLAGRPAGLAPPPPADLPEGRWLSSKPQGSSTPPEVVAGLDGKRVRIGGYVVPLDFDARQVKEFLLVPFVGACIHVPPPPANQIVYVKSAKGYDVNATFDPVWVTGKLTTAVAFTGLAEAGYSLEAEAIETRKE